MKRVFSIVLTIAFVASGCSNNVSATNAPSELPRSATPTQITVTPSYTATVTQTPLPTITSTPAITSTFDPTTIITRTPSTAAQCPAIADVQSPSISKPELPVLSFEENEKTVLYFLNQGGRPETLITVLNNSRWLRHGKNNAQIKDLTGDDVAEIVISPSETYVLGCRSGKYSILLKIDNLGIAINWEQNHIFAIEDMNLDGIPELAVASYSCGGMSSGMCLDGWIFEWNGSDFSTIAEVSMGGRQISGAQPVMKVENTNRDQLLELNVIGGISTSLDNPWYFPWRQETDIYTWNGSKFVLQNVSFSNPQFRYQVIQDADRTLAKGNYDEAIKFYQNVIYGNYDWFSEERKQYIIDNANGIPGLIMPDPDPKEQPNLAGYAFFRIMVTYILQGNIDEAQTAYDRIRENFSIGSPGYDYVIIAEDFWNEYQSSQDIEKTCGKAIDYAVKNQNLLMYLGSDYHNIFQDIVYGPTDICPFKE